MPPPYWLDHKNSAATVINAMASGTAYTHAR